MGTRLAGPAQQRALALGLLALGLLLAALAARAAPSHPFHATSRAPLRVPPSSARHLPGVSRGALRPDAPPTSGSTPLWVLLVFGVLVLVVLVLLLRRWRPRRRFRDEPEPVRGAALVSPPPGAEQVAAAVERGRAPLDRGPVAESIIACWVAVGESLRRAGLEPRRTETSAEYVERVLADYGGDEAALRELSALYREARFSIHPLTEADRAAARRCVDAIRGGLAGAAPRA